MEGPEEMIHNAQDLIDSRDVIARIEELAAEANEKGPGALTDEELTELANLRALDEQGKRSATDWEHGATLVHADYLPEYVKDYAEDINGIDTSVWPFDCINWEEAADEFVRFDYSELDFYGQSYFVRH